jgi:hypothetical protein
MSILIENFGMLVIPEYQSIEGMVVDITQVMYREVVI